MGLGPGTDQMQGAGPRSWEPRTLLPSVSSKASCTRSRNPSSNPRASRRAKTRPSVSYEGIPWGSARKGCSHSSLSSPKRAMATKLSVPQPGPVDARILQGVQHLDQGRRHRAVYEGVLHRLKPEPTIVATGQPTPVGTPNLDAIALAPRVGRPCSAPSCA